MKVVAMLRVKNEARWIRKTLDSLLPLAETVLVMDDGSTDETAHLCSAYDRVTVLPSPFADQPIDEVRDKNWLLAAAGREDPTWVICIDGDEALMEADIHLLNELMATHAAPAYSLRVLYLWDDEQHMRVDGIYGRFTRPSVFRWKPGTMFHGTGQGGNFHCSNIPREMHTDARKVDVRLLHYGYMHKADRLRKYEWYNRIDPQNDAEDCYRHMVLGDMPHLPANMGCKWAGPLEVQPL